MKKTLKRLFYTIIILWIIGGAWFAAYTYIPAVKNIFTPWYSDSYALEEVNQKILTLQKKAVDEIEKEYQKAINASKSQKINGVMWFSLDANSSFWGGGWSMNVDTIDLQYNETWIDLLLEWLTMSWSAQMLGEQITAGMNLDTLHMLANASWSYIQVKNLKTDLSSLWSEILPEEVIMTLNKLWDSWKYINLSENFLYSIIEAQLTSQGAETAELQQEITEFLKNEVVFSAHRQEETKYHLAPSQAICTLMKVDIVAEWEVDISRYPKSNSFSYEKFKSSYQACDRDEYIEFIEKFKQSPVHEISNFYIELNTTKVHYVFDALVNAPESSDIEINFEVGAESTFSLTKSESTKVYMRIINDTVTGSWMLIEQLWDNMSGYVDIDIPSYNFDSNLTLTWTLQDTKIMWDYSFVAPEEFEDKRLDSLAGVKINGSMNASFLPESYDVKITNMFSHDPLSITWEAILQTSWNITQTTHTWSMVLSGELTMWANASPITWDIKANWNMETTPSLVKWDINYTLNIPNIASGKQSINYNFTLSDTPESKFETPANVIPQKNLDTLIKINKKIIEKERAKQAREKFEKLKNWNNTYTQQEATLINISTSSDLRTIASAIEVDVTSSWKSLDNYVSNKEVVKTASGTLYSWTINFNELNLNGSPIISKMWIPYDIRTYSLKTEWKTRAFYQVSWYTIRNDSLERITKWNYIKMDNSMPDSLFDIEIK